MNSVQNFLASHADDHVSSGAARQMYARFAPNKFSLNDRGYLAGVNPLELWLVSYLYQHPHVTRSQVIAASSDQRKQAYTWLMKAGKTSQQNVRIREITEEDAFGLLLQDWKQQGYPFGHLVPSLATAIGSSGDRPDALATLMGIILNDGVRQPAVDLEHVLLAADTPFETEMIYRPEAPTRVMSAEVAATLRRALTGVVDTGTAVRAPASSLGPDGKSLPIGGKTGTGDNRFESFGPGHQLIESRLVDRTATFVFFLRPPLWHHYRFRSGGAGGSFQLHQLISRDAIKNAGAGTPCADRQVNGRIQGAASTRHSRGRPPPRLFHRNSAHPMRPSTGWLLLARTANLNDRPEFSATSMSGSARILWGRHWQAAAPPATGAPRQACGGTRWRPLGDTPPTKWVNGLPVRMITGIASPTG